MFRRDNMFIRINNLRNRKFSITLFIGDKIFTSEQYYISYETLINSLKLWEQGYNNVILIDEVDYIEFYVIVNEHERIYIKFDEYDINSFDIDLCN